MILCPLEDEEFLTEGEVFDLKNGSIEPSIKAR